MVIQVGSHAWVAPQARGTRKESVEVAWMRVGFRPRNPALGADPDREKLYTGCSKGPKGCVCDWCEGAGVVAIPFHCVMWCVACGRKRRIDGCVFDLVRLIGRGLSVPACAA